MTIAVRNVALTTITSRRSVVELTREAIVIDPYDPEWPDEFERESIFLRRTLPKTIVGRIEHIGSTAVQGLAAKPIIDLLVDVTSYNEVEEQVVPMLESQGYEYYWRNDMNPGHAWFIKRNVTGTRTHHIHMVEADAPFWVRLYFRDYLREFPQEAKRYETLKYDLAKRFPNDREAYTEGKTHFITSVTEKAREYYLMSRCL